MINYRENCNFMLGQGVVKVKPCDICTNIKVNVDAPLPLPVKCTINIEFILIIIIFMIILKKCYCGRCCY